MRLIVAAALTVSLFLVSAARAQSGDEPRAIVARAVQALGGEARLSKAKATHRQIKGTLYVAGQFPFTLETFSQPPDRSKDVWQLDPQGNKTTVIHVLDGNKGWSRDNGITQEADKSSFADLKETAYMNVVISLWPLLKQNNFKLLPLGEVKVQGQAATGVSISSAGNPDVALFFDKGTGLLVKVEYKRREAGRQVLTEVYLSDYREVFSAAAEEQALKAAKLATDDAALLELLRKQTLTDAKREQIQSLIRKLGDASFQIREKAKEDLIKQGEAAVPLLSRVLKDPDPEVASRAKDCLGAIGKPAAASVPPAVVRLVALRQPAGAAEVLLAYLPCVADENAAQEVQAALAAVAVRDGKPDPVLVQALEDKDPQRRTAAAAALGRQPEPGKERPGQQLFLPGLKRARKSVYFQDGKKLLEYEEEDVKFFNKFKDDVFGKP